MRGNPRRPDKHCGSRLQPANGVGLTPGGLRPVELGSHNVYPTPSLNELGFLIFVQSKRPDKHCGSRLQPANGVGLTSGGLRPVELGSHNVYPTPSLNELGFLIFVQSKRPDKHCGSRLQPANGVGLTPGGLRPPSPSGTGLPQCLPSPEP